MTSEQRDETAESADRARIDVGALDDFPVGQFVIREIRGKSIGIIRLSSGEVRAVLNYCPHKGAPICRGIVGGTWPPVSPGDLQFAREGEVLACPWHGFEYDLLTGQEMFGTGRTKLHLYEAIVSDGMIRIVY